MQNILTIAEDLSGMVFDAVISRRTIQVPTTKAYLQHPFAVHPYSSGCIFKNNFSHKRRTP